MPVPRGQEAEARVESARWLKFPIQGQVVSSDTEWTRQSQGEIRRAIPKYPCRHTHNAQDDNGCRARGERIGSKFAGLQGCRVAGIPTRIPPKFQLIASSTVAADVYTPSPRRLPPLAAFPRRLPGLDVRALQLETHHEILRSPNLVWDPAYLIARVMS